MPKLNQVIAVVTGQKSEMEKGLTEVYHALQKPELFSGHARTYTPKDAADTDVKPPERKNPQKSVKDLYASIEPVLIKTFDNVATQDWGNTQAKADIIVDGKALLENVPVTNLLFLEHKLTELKAFVEKMPVRDGAENWEYSPDANQFVGAMSRKDVTSKKQVPIVLLAPTEHHPGQAQLITKDEVVGHWDERKFSTAISAKDKETMMNRVIKISEAVKEAREAANSIDVTKKEVGKTLLEAVFGGILTGK